MPDPTLRTTRRQIDDAVVKSLVWVLEGTGAAVPTRWNMYEGCQNGTNGLQAGFENALESNFARLALVCLMSTIFAISACEPGEDAPMTADALDWGYSGPGGPENWASLSEEYAACAIGTQQSPIDITGYKTGDAPSVSFSYSGDATAVRNDGHTVHVDYASGNKFTVGQQTFNLKSAHLHSPSEHHVDGVSFAAELHLVHADVDGNLAVVGMLFRTGEPSPVVQAILGAAPAADNTVSEGFTLNAGDYAPNELGYYRYDGSKTTPPCDEPVSWYMMREQKTISPEQVANLLALSGGSTNRPIQPTGSRVIIFSGAS